MPENLALQLVFGLYVVSLLCLFYVSYQSRNDLILSFGVIFGIYSLGFLYQSFVFDYFSVTIEVVFTIADYLRLLLLNCTIVLIFVICERETRTTPTHVEYNQILGAVFLMLGLVAMLVELRFYGVSDFFIVDKTLKLSGKLDSVNNLFLISIDYHIFMIAGAYSLAMSVQRRSWQLVFYAIILGISMIGFLQGHRYYLAATFMFVVLVYAKRRWHLNIWTVSALILVGLFLAETSKILLSWILYYDWVRDWGFLNYFAFSYTDIVPQEVKAIATNTYLGYNVYADQLQPDMLGYLIKVIPFSERFYDFSSFDQLYKVISQDLNIGEGEGTAFSFFLDNYQSYYVPVLALWFALWLSQIHPTPIVKVVVLFFLLNLIRNGFLVSISVLKLPLLIYGAAYLALMTLDSLGILHTLFRRASSGQATGQPSESS